MKKDHIMVKVAIDTIKKMLFDRLEGSMHTRRIIADAVVENLVETEVGLEQIYMAMQGIEIQIPFAVGDRALVPFDSLATWRLDLDKTQEAGLLVKGCVVAEITEINPRKAQPIYVKYKAVKKNGTEPEEDTWILKASDVTIANEELPDEEELPF